jgi:hypothetical protein
MRKRRKKRKKEVDYYEIWKTETDPDVAKDGKNHVSINKSSYGTVAMG